MKIKSLLLGSAAALVAVSGVQAADLDPEPMEYVKVCNLWDDFGDAYFIPSKDICLKVGGRIRSELAYTVEENFVVSEAFIEGIATTDDGASATDPNHRLPNSALAPVADGTTGLVRDGGDDSDLDGETTFRARAYVRLESRSLTDFGTLRTFMDLFFTVGHDGTVTTPTLDAGYIQWGGITFGKAATNMTANFGGYNYGSVVGASVDAFHTINQLAYTFSTDFGFSAGIAIEDSRARQSGIRAVNYTDNAAGTITAGTATWGDTITTLVAGTEDEQLPDLVANVRVDQSWGSFDVAGALHNVEDNTGITMLGLGEPRADNLGYAIGADLIIKLPMLSPGSEIGVGVVYAEGASDYVGTITRGLAPVDVVVSDQAVDGTYAEYVTEEFNVTAGIKHQFTPTVTGSLDGSWGYSENDAWLEFDYWGLAANVTWAPTSGFAVGAEIAYETVDVDQIYGAAVAATEEDEADAWSVVFRMQRTF